MQMRFSTAMVKCTAAALCPATPQAQNYPNKTTRVIVPTVVESGLKGVEALQWFGMFSPAGMRADVIARFIVSGTLRIRRS